MLMRWGGLRAARLIVAAAVLVLVRGYSAAQEGAPAQVPPAPTADFDALLRAQPYFKKILWTTDASFAPFEILVQKQAVPEAGYEKSIANFYGPWLVRLAQVFDQSVAKPAMLPPGSDPRPIRLIVLSSEGDFVNFCKLIHTYDSLDPSAFYDERIRAVVTHWDMPGAAHERRYAALRMFVFALLHQRSTGFEGRQPPWWIREGLSIALAWHTGRDPAAAFTTLGVNPRVYEQMLKLSQDPATQNRFLRPLESLVEITSFADLRNRAQKEAKSAGRIFSDQDPWYQGFYCQSALWIEYLLRDGATEHNEAFRKYLRAAMRGGGGPADLRKSFEGVDLSALDLEFFRWSYARMRELKLRTPDDSKLATLFRTPPDKPEKGASAPKADPAAQATPQPSIAERLAVPLEDPRIVRALALRTAAAGDIEAALAQLAPALAKGGDDADLAGVRAEVARLEAWKRARDLWLAELLRTGGRLQFEREGKPLTRRLIGVADGELTLESAKGSEKLAVALLRPGLLAAQMKSLPEGSPEWVRCYGWILGEDPRWEKQLKDKGDAATALRADASGAYVELRQLGKAVVQLASLAAASAPANESEARAVLEALGTTLREVPTQALVVARMNALRALGTLAAGLLHDATKPAPSFAGKVTWIDEDTVELLYEFDAESELDDWVQSTVNPDPKRLTGQKITLPQEKQGFSILNGAWAGRGLAVLTHTLPFEAPMHILIQLRHGFAESEDVDIGHFVVGLCHDPERGYVAFAEGGESFLIEKASGTDAFLPSSNLDTAPLGEPTALEISHDGTRLRYVHLGTAEPELPKHSLRSGGVFLLAMTNRVVMLDSIRIRAKLNADSRAKLREQWIATMLREAGFP